MSILAKHFLFVKDQVDFHTRQSIRFAPASKTPSAYREKLHNATLEKFEELAADLIKADEELDSRPQRATSLPQQIFVSTEEVEGLPDELLKELSSSVTDKSDLLILSLAKEYGGIVSLDRLLVDLFKRTNEIHKRSALTSRLYRMAQKGLIFSVPGRKGFYSITELTEDDAQNLFGPAETASQAIAQN